MSERQEKGVSNNQTNRGISNGLDYVMGWSGESKNNSYTRSVIHGVYHKCVGYYKETGGNMEGANAEYRRAAEQFGPKKGNCFSPGRK